MTEQQRTGAEGRHVPVLRERILDLLEPALTATVAVPAPVHVDGTLGMGGHAEAVLERFPDVVLVGIDRDTEALRLAGERLSRFGDRVHLVHATYDQVGVALADLGLPGAQGILLDLGVSSLQLDEQDRGFAYRVDAPLDMRMDQSEGITAAEILNTYAHGDLARVLRVYGEERFAKQIASAVVREREKQAFTTSGRLVELLRRVIPTASQRQGGHPGKRTFQALRIEVNRELESLEAALPAAVDALAVGGRLGVLSYHSLEDRLTKQVLAAGARSTAPPGLPVELPEHAPYLRLLTRGAEEPGAPEIAANPRAASARLRAAERLRTSPATRPHQPSPTRKPRRNGSPS
ncbi:16S rRNA (cytosine(1402)-N(4))-methyltransferase RsmH [Arsenicicoccus dermatophilus]|uniref:16S rRNA (cytosine(1402)-N(4))-methyltransferase RsmH n=1 Tax=Arsenicicoccus dermatophilus TaxID=1076331 RepID=UPI003916EA82